MGQAFLQDQTMLLADALSMDQIFFRNSNLEDGTKIVVKPLETTIQTRDTPDVNCNFENQGDPSVCTENYQCCDPLECGSTVQSSLSDSRFISLSDAFGAAWTGKTQSGTGSLKDNSLLLTASVSVDSSLAVVVEKLALEHHAEEKAAAKTTACSSPVAFTNSKAPDSAEDTLSRLGMPCLRFYRSSDISFRGSDQKLDKLGGYNSNKEGTPSTHSG